MPKEDETVLDVVAEIRTAGYPFEWSRKMLNGWLDRIERAAKRAESAFGMALAIEDGVRRRERVLAAGDLAKLRGALDDIISDCDAALSRTDCRAKDIYIRSARSEAKGAFRHIESLIDRTKRDAKWKQTKK